MIVFSPDWSFSAEIASAVAVGCLLPAPILAVIAVAELRVARSRLVLQRGASGGQGTD